MNQSPGEMLAAGRIIPTLLVGDAFRIYYPDAIIPGAFWHFSREPHPATGPAASFRLIGYIPPAGKAIP